MVIIDVQSIRDVQLRKKQVIDWCIEKPYKRIDELIPPIRRYFIPASFDLISFFCRTT
jgi:hypothetical protein